MSRIFQPREATKKSTQFADDVVGRFRSGYQINNRPASLKEWRVTTGDPEVADTLREMLGGDEPQEWDAKGEDNLEVFTAADELDIIIESAKGVDARMVIWSRGQKKFFVCGGEAFEPEGSEPFICEDGDYTTRAEHDEQGHVCEPNIKIKFRLRDDPELGVFEFMTGAWSLASVLGYAMSDLERAGGAAYATLALEPVEFQKEGKTIKFTKPVLSVGEAYEPEED